MIHAHLRSCLSPSRIVAVLLAGVASAQDWSNQGGNAARNGLTSEVGPSAADPAWSNTDDPAVISWHPYVSDGRVFTIRESGFPTSGGAANDALVAYDLGDGHELWRATLAYGGNPNTEWIAWIAGAANGKVYAARSENGKAGPIRAYDAVTGQFLWNSTLTTQAFAYDGAVFAPDGDLLVGDLAKVARIDGVTGGTVWSTPRIRAVSGNCGPAATASAVFIDQVVPGGQIVSKLDIDTGMLLYSSPTMPGFTEQNQPFLAPDGATVYFSRTQNNALVDFLYAFEDTGSALVERWHRSVRWTTSHEHGIAADGSLYTFLPTNELVRLDPATGDVTATSGVLAPIGVNLSPKTVVDGAGKVYVSNGWANNPATNGRVWAFDPDLTQNLFTLVLPNLNQGGPVLGAEGTLVVSDLNGLHAYRACSAATAVLRNSGTNPPSYTASLPVLGATFTGTVDLGGTTGHPIAALVGFRDPLQVTLGGGQTLLVDPSSLGRELLDLPAMAGPLAVFQLAIPNDASLCGFELATQAVHVGGGQPFALSNAQDLRIGGP